MNRSNSMIRPLLPVLLITLTSFLPVPACADFPKARLEMRQQEAFKSWSGRIGRATDTALLRAEAEEALKVESARYTELLELAGTIEAERKQLEQEEEALIAKQNVLSEEKKELETDKKELESEKKLFQTGFFATFSTTILGFAALIVRIPNSTLDKRLKLIQIAQKEYELKNKKVPIPK